MGKRLASEVLLLDRPLTAKEAVDCGFANAVIPDLQNEPEWFDINKVPAIPKLLETDYRTLTNCKRVLNFAKDK
jgi:enoyl-CoA hydratase/carnithine racemase